MNVLILYSRFGYCPARPKRLVDGNQRGGGIRSTLGEKQLRAQRAAFRVEHFEEIHQTTLEALARQVSCSDAGSGCKLQCLSPRLGATVGNHRALCVLERAQHCALIAS